MDNVYNKCQVSLTEWQDDHEEQLKVFVHGEKLLFQPKYCPQKFICMLGPKKEKMKEIEKFVKLDTENENQTIEMNFDADNYWNSLGHRCLFGIDKL